MAFSPSASLPGAPAHDAIAIVGVSCRLPADIASPDEFWTALLEGRDLISEAPPERFDASRWFDPDPRRPGKAYSTAGGFLTGIQGFDAGYFNMSPREAGRLDPLQRMLLEMAVEAVDDAGIATTALTGSSTAVYVGSSSQSFAALQGLDSRSANAYTMSGGAAANIANRVSHFLDLRGPSVTVDTACSSSLVAVHHACEALRGDRCTMALAAGAHVLLSPFEYVGFSKASMLSPTHRCRTFSADADGYVRAEGGGLVVLKPLSRALEDGDRVRAVILGSGVNTDGRTPGLAQPSADAQAALLREVYAAAGVSPDEVAYVEMHGTGTPVGDPVECQAVGEALAQKRAPGRALPVGSAKSHLGHMEPASGMAGLLKAMLVLRHGQVPANLHARPLNPEIDFEGWRLAPAVETRPLDIPSGSRAVAGVNSFGFGGANAHVILARGPEPVPARTPGANENRLPVLVSARTRTAALAAARRMADRLRQCAPEEFYDLACTAFLRRGRHEQRAVVLAADPTEAATHLYRLAEGEQEVAGALAPAARQSGVALAFSGNGSQWAGMGADLLNTEPSFLAGVADADEALRPLLDWSVLAELTAPADRRRADTTDVAQPLLFAVQVGLVSVLRTHGIRPTWVVGHSAGEMAAAWTAGVLSLDAAARVVVERSRAQASTAGNWGMAAVGADPERIRHYLSPYTGRLEIAGINSGQDITVSGDKTALAELGRTLQGQGVFFRDLGLDYAFHSHAMDPLRDGLLTALDGLKARRGDVHYASATTGALLDYGAMDPSYWWRNLRQPVLFASAIERLLELGCETFVEVGPHPVLGGYLRRLAGSRQSPSSATVLPTLRRDTDGPAAVRSAVAHLLAAGHGGGESVFFPRPGRVVDLPAYPWERERHWNGDPSLWVGGCGDGTIDHPLLGERAAAAEPTWHGPFDPARLPWLADHKIGEAVVMPATGLVEMALAAGRRVHKESVEITDLTIPRALVLPFGDEPELQLQTTLSTDDGIVQIAARAQGSETWQQHARARVRRLYAPPPGLMDLDEIAADLPGRKAVEEHYTAAARGGLHYGPAFQVLSEHLLSGVDQVLARYSGVTDLSGYEAHPTLLDGALQAGLPLIEKGIADQAGFLPVAIDRVRAWRRMPSTGHIHVRSRAISEREALWDVTVLAANGLICLTLEGCRLRRFDEAARTPGPHYSTVMRAAPREGQDFAAADTVVDPREIARLCRDEVRGTQATWQRCGGAAAFVIARELAAHFGTAAVGTLLADADAEGGPFTIADLIAAGALPQYAKLLGLLLETAHAHGLVEPVMTAGDDNPAGGDRRWRMLRPAQPQERFRALTDEHPEQAVGLSLLGRFGTQLVAVLRGDRDPMEEIFSEANRYLLEEFYTDTGMTYCANRGARAVVETMVRQWPADRPLRVLEVGAGTGGTTAFLLPVLPPERTRYTYTDVSATFFPRAQNRFAVYDFVDYRVLDLDQDPVGQGFAEGSFDLVVASDALHASRHLRPALDHVSTLLADNGTLLVVEAHDPASLALLFGLLPSFWDQQDTDLRPSGPLLSLAAWRELLSEAGYRQITALECNDAPQDSEQPRIEDFSVLVARRSCRPVPAAALTPSEHAPAPGRSRAWIVVSEPAHDRLAAALAERLSTSSGLTVRRSPLLRDTDRWSALLTERPEPAGVVVLLGEDTAHETEESDAGGYLDLDRAVEHAAVLRSLAVAADRLAENTETGLWLVTPPSGALPEPEQPLNPTASSAWGVARCLGNEYPGLLVHRVSLENCGRPEAAAARLAAELTEPTAEDEILLTRSGRFVPRVRQRADLCRSVVATASSSFALRLREPGRSYRLVWSPAATAQPGPDEIVVSVRAAALNYRDVLQALGAVPLDDRQGDSAGADYSTGMECAGTVVSVGSSVTAFSPGDRVFAFGSGTLGSHVTVPATMAGSIPDHMSFAQASTLPVVFLTVHHSLHHLARLSPGETVLVHGAAGGVGLAALQYAQRAGAHVIATAGTPTKRDLLRLLGIHHVLDSRTLGFAERVKALTGGQGVDVILNSLAGEAITRGLEALRTGGRFIELGKRDLYGNSRLLLRPFLHNITFSAADLAGLAQARPGVMAAQFEEVVQGVHEGIYRPILHHVYPADRVTEAFEALQHSRHIGKVVISMERPPMLQVAPRQFEVGRQGTYLVTGGLSGLGAATARWLAERGARRLALVGRRGADTPEAPALLEQLRTLGVAVTTHAADTADMEAMRSVLAEADTPENPLRGVVHAAMVLDDAPLAELTDDRVRRVLAAKAQGADVLHRLTRNRELDLFVLYSSAAAMLGSKQQSNYVGANLFLESLARARQRSVRPALAVAWGAMDEVGYVARHELSNFLRKMGLDVVSPREALDALGSLVTRGEEVAMVARIDWGQAQHSVSGINAPRFTAFRSSAGHGGGKDDQLIQKLATVSADQALALVTEALTDILSRILQTTADHIPSDKPLDQLGLDSLMGAELVAAIRQRLGCDLPTVELLNSATVSDLAQRCMRRIGRVEADPST
ncbi:type I polyketide synthase [Streptomyces gobiensis]|uniref:type I polyketide synthase n=1 Tax=Streptomyces gobiensis TaxID=2875706 RepID=UPI001E5C6C63|nr:type I polyketide synthase [Streptomyces gobiensis]UGY91169.1 SDR family NAD(P)-dependent oxidoreductase [Streptomyces gobiensis]